MLPFTLSNVRTLIDEYLAAHPDGTDVTAFVLSHLGRESVEAHARAAGISPGRANQEVGATVREMLLRKHPEAEPEAALCGALAGLPCRAHGAGA